MGTVNNDLSSRVATRDRQETIASLIREGANASSCPECGGSGKVLDTRFNPPSKLTCTKCAGFGTLSMAEALDAAAEAFIAPLDEDW